jgi:hypothetical protein
VPKQSQAVTEYITRDALNVAEFCRSHGISRGLFYLAQRDGIGPRVMRVRNRVLISAEAAAEWRGRMEARAETAPTLDGPPSAD